MLPVALGGIALALMYSSGPQNNIEVEASDGQKYKVQNLPDKQQAAERMSEIKRNLNCALFLSFILIFR